MCCAVLAPAMDDVLKTPRHHRLRLLLFGRTGLIVANWRQGYLSGNDLRYPH